MSSNQGRYGGLAARLTETVLATPGDTSSEKRQAALERGKHPGSSGRTSLPPEVASYIDTVARHAYRVTDADVAGLKEAGYSDDAIFEITVAAAVGAAMHRLDRGMAALRGEEPD